MYSVLPLERPCSHRSSPGTSGDCAHLTAVSHVCCSMDPQCVLACASKLRSKWGPAATGARTLDSKPSGCFVSQAYPSHLLASLHQFCEGPQPQPTIRALAARRALGSNLFGHIALHELALELHQGRLDVLLGQSCRAHDAGAHALHEGPQQAGGLGSCCRLAGISCTMHLHASK